MSSSYEEQINESLINLFLTLRKLVCKEHVFVPPVIQLFVITCELEVGRLSDQHLTHLIHEK